MTNPIIDILSQNIFLMRNVFRAAHTIKHKISNTEAYIIILLFEKPSTRTKLTQIIKRDQTTVYRNVRGLWLKGYITMDSADICSLTPKGIALYQEILNLIVQE